MNRSLSRMAISSLGFAILAFFLLLDLALRPYSPWLGAGLLISIFLAVSLGVSALIVVRRSHGSLRGKLIATLGSSLGLIVLLWITFVFGVQDRNPIAANESRAVARLRNLADAGHELSQSKSLPSSSCTLRDLDNYIKALSHNQKSDVRNDGYRIEVASCNLDAHMFRISAVPLKPGATGVRAFCTDQTSIIRYVPLGTAEECFQEGKPLE